MMDRSSSLVYDFDEDSNVKSSSMLPSSALASSPPKSSTSDISDSSHIMSKSIPDLSYSAVNHSPNVSCSLPASPNRKLNRESIIESKIVSDLGPIDHDSYEEDEQEVYEKSDTNDYLLIDEAVDNPRDGEDDKVKGEESAVETTQKAFRGRPSSCVFVASLSSVQSDNHLCDSVKLHFQQWGEIALVKVLRDQANRPYAFVQFTNDTDAQIALLGAQHTVLDGRTIRCEPARVNRTLFVTPVNQPEFSEQGIRRYFSQFGEIEAMISQNKNTRLAYDASTSWFIKFAYRDDAIRGYASLKANDNWSVEWAQNIETCSQAPFSTIDKLSVFVGQLNSSVTKDQLCDRFSTHGAIVSCNLIIRQPEVRDGEIFRNNSFAFIKYNSEAAAAQAVEQENHTVFMNKTIHVQYREIYMAQLGSRSVNNEPRLALAPPPVTFINRYQNQDIGIRRHSFAAMSSEGIQKSKWRVSSLRTLNNLDQENKAAQSYSHSQASSSSTRDGGDSWMSSDSEGKSIGFSSNKFSTRKTSFDFSATKKNESTGDKAKSVSDKNIPQTDSFKRTSSENTQSFPRGNTGISNHGNFGEDLAQDVTTFGYYTGAGSAPTTDGFYQMPFVMPFKDGEYTPGAHPGYFHPGYSFFPPYGAPINWTGQGAPMTYFPGYYCNTDPSIVAPYMQQPEGHRKSG